MVSYSGLKPLHSIWEIFTGINLGRWKNRLAVWIRQASSILGSRPKEYVAKPAITLVKMTINRGTTKAKKSTGNKLNLRAQNTNPTYAPWEVIAVNAQLVFCVYKNRFVFSSLPWWVNKQTCKFWTFEGRPTYLTWGYLGKPKAKHCMTTCPNSFWST